MVERGTPSFGDGRQFSWGGQVAIFMVEDGIHLFGAGSKRGKKPSIITKQWFLIFVVAIIGISFISAYLLIAFVALPSFMNSMIAAIIGAIASGVFLSAYLRRIKRETSRYPSSPKFEDFFQSDPDHEFFDWSRVRSVKLELIAGRRVVNVVFNDPSRKGFAIGVPDKEVADRLKGFLSEKLGESGRLNGDFHYKLFRQ